jgi:ABC-type sugar transport system, periplasmic component
MKRITALLLTAAFVMSAFVGCNSNSNSTNSESTTNSEIVATEANAGETKTVYVIVKVLGNQYWSILQAGAEKAGKDLGINVVIQGTASEAEVEKQVELLQNAVSAQADAIIIAPLDTRALDRPIAEAHASGIPVILVDTIIASDNYSAALMTDNVVAGEEAAKQLLTQLIEAGTLETEEAQVAIQIGSAGSQTIIDRVKGFNEYWDANAPEAWVVMNDDVKVNDGDITKAVAFAQDFITTYPNLKAVFGPNNGSTVGFVKGLTEANRTDIAMVGFDFSPEIESMMREGSYNVSSVVQRQYFMGYNGVEIALELINGGSVSEKTVDTGVMLVTADNVDSPEVQEIINPE